MENKALQNDNLQEQTTNNDAVLAVAGDYNGLNLLDDVMGALTRFGGRNSRISFDLREDAYNKFLEWLNRIAPSVKEPVEFNHSVFQIRVNKLGSDVPNFR